MKIKPIGKVFILIIVGILAFFGIRKYQASHPSTIVKTDSIVSGIKIDSTVKQVDSTLAKPQDTPVYPPAIGRPGDIQKVRHHDHDATKKNHSKKDDGTDRKNLDLQNY